MEQEIKTIPDPQIMNKKNRFNIAIIAFFASILILSGLHFFTTNLLGRSDCLTNQNPILCELFWLIILEFIVFPIIPVISILVALIYYFLSKKRKWLNFVLILNIILVIFAFSFEYYRIKTIPDSNLNKKEMDSLNNQIRSNFPNIDCEKIINHKYMLKDCYLSVMNISIPRENINSCSRKFQNNDSVQNCVIKADKTFYEDNICDKIKEYSCSINYFGGSPIDYLSHYPREDYKIDNCSNIKDNNQKYNCYLYAFNFDLSFNDRSICKKVDDLGYEKYCNDSIDDLFLDIVKGWQNPKNFIWSKFNYNDHYLYGKDNNEYLYLCDWIMSDNVRNECKAHKPDIAI